MGDLTLRELLDRGDWACAHGEADALADVCRRLAPRLDAALARLAEATAFACQCPGGMGEASLLWARLNGAARRPT